MVSKFVGYYFTVSFLALSVVSLVTASASSKSPYESGYDHGCDDADISDPNDRYINQPEKGPSFHTNEFMRGYNDGYDDCSGGGNGEYNDPCNYHGLYICDSNGNCDSERFDCLSDDCVNGQPATTGQCEGDDEPYDNNDSGSDSNSDDGSGSDDLPQEVGCQEDDDYCDADEGCRSESVDCIDDRNFDEDDYDG
jgi:hypothetical protein